MVGAGLREKCQELSGGHIEFEMLVGCAVADEQAIG